LCYKIKTYYSPSFYKYVVSTSGRLSYPYIKYNKSGTTKATYLETRYRSIA